MNRNRLSRYEGADGFVLDWVITGFFANGTRHHPAPNLYDAKHSRHWRRDYLAPYGGEATIRHWPRPLGVSPVEWVPVRGEADSPKIFLPPLLRTCPELASAFPGESRWDHQWYALALIESDTDQEAELRLCGQDGCRVWWNGKFVFEEHSWHKLAYDLNVIPVRLKKGRNALLLKLDRYGFVVRVTRPGGGKLKGTVCALAKPVARSNSLGTLEQLRRYARTLKVTQPCLATTASGYDRWRRSARAHFRDRIGSFPAMPEPRAPVARVAKVPRDGYTRFTYLLPREAGTVMPVHVLMPDRRLYNGRTVICPHGHGQDDKVVAGIEPPAKPYGNWCGPFTGHYAEFLAQAGFITATWAGRALSHERQDTQGTGDPCAAAALCAQAMGMTLPGLHIFDLHGVADFVAGLPGVDRTRMGLTGLSGGGTLTYLAGAYDDRFKAVAVFCGLLGYADYARGQGCGMQVVPGLYPVLDVGQVLSLIAPRPLLLGQGRRDVGFNVFSLERFAREARRAYRLTGHEELLEVCLYDLAHQVNRDAAIDFFTRVL